MPLRHGKYIAEMAVVPVSAAQKALEDANEKVDSYGDENALRTATVNYLRENDAEFEIRIQLCTDIEKMPVENANKEWDEKESPYLPVARIKLPKQEAYSEARQQKVEALSFSVAHCLEDHKPLGSIMRAGCRLTRKWPACAGRETANYPQNQLLSKKFLHKLSDNLHNYGDLIDAKPVKVIYKLCNLS